MDSIWKPCGVNPRFFRISSCGPERLLDPQLGAHRWAWHWGSHLCITPLPPPRGLAWCKHSPNWQHGPARMQGLPAGEALGAPVGDPACGPAPGTWGAHVCPALTSDSRASWLCLPSCVNIMTALGLSVGRPHGGLPPGLPPAGMPLLGQSRCRCPQVCPWPLQPQEPSPPIFPVQLAQPGDGHRP